MITNDAKCTHEIKSRIAMAKEAFNKKTLFTRKLDLKFKEEISKMVHFEPSFLWCSSLNISEGRSKESRKF